MIESKMKYVLDAEDRTKSALSSAESGLRGFAKQATSAAAGFGLYDIAKQSVIGLKNELISLGESGMQAASIEESFNRLANQMQLDGDQMIQKLKEVSAGTVSNTDLMLSSNRAMALGVGNDMDTVTTLMEIARVKGRALGLDTTQAFNDIVTGIGRGSPLILDNLGITIKLGEAQENYARELNKTVDQLTDNEKKNALLNAVMKEGRRELDAMGEVTKTASERYQSLQATMKNIQDNIGKALLPGLEVLFDSFQANASAVENNSNAFDTLGKYFYSTIYWFKAMGQVLYSVSSVIGAFGVSLYDAGNLAYSFARDVADNIKTMGENVKHVVHAIGLALKGDFMEAWDEFQKAGQKGFSLENTIEAWNNFGDVSSAMMNEAKLGWDAAARYMGEALERNFYQPARSGSEELAYGLGGDAEATADKVSKEYQDAALKMIDAAESAQDKIGDVIDSYGERTADSLERHLGRIEDFNASIEEANDAFNSSSLSRDSNYQSQQLSLYMGHQDKIAQLQEQSQNLRERMSNASDDQEKARLQNQVSEVQKSIQEEQKIIDQYSDLASQAKAYREQTDLERLKAKYDEQVKADQEALDKRLSAIQQQITAENVEYEKQSAKLKVQTQQRMDDILDEYRKGYAKIIQESKVSGIELEAVLAMARADVEKLAGLSTSSIGAVSLTSGLISTSKRSGTTGGGTQFNFTFNGDITDKDTLIKSITDAVNRASQIAGASSAW